MRRDDNIDLTRVNYVVAYRREQGANERVDLGEDLGCVDDGCGGGGLREVGIVHDRDGRQQAPYP